LNASGWSAVQFAALPTVAVALAVLIWSARRTALPPSDVSG
jgi:hypothetical protein